MKHDFDALVDSTRGLQPLRRLLHAGAGLVLAGGLWVVQPPRVLSIAAFGALVLALLTADLIRLKIPRSNLLFFRMFRTLVSPREVGGIASSTWYMAGILITLSLFPIEAVIPAILVLALADPAANYAGRRWGRRLLGTGTVEGVTVFVLVATSILSFVVDLPIALLAGLLAAVIEIVPWRLDDNVTIPLVVAGVLWMGGVLISG